MLNKETLCDGLPKNDLYTLSPDDIKKLTRNQKIQILRELRIRPMRRPVLALMCATDVLAKGGGGLMRDEIYSVYEQAFIAALDCGQTDQAILHLKMLKKTFGPSSIRVCKLECLFEEAKGNNAAALKLYANILNEIPNDAFVVKRQSAIFKAKGDLAKAIDVLENQICYYDENKNPLTFQKVHALDVGANKELCSLYLQVGNIEKALFYAEEGILADPFDYALHNRHAELAYCAKQYDCAIAAFSQSLILNDNPNNTRAAYGLWMAAKEADNQNRSHNEKLSSEYDYKALQQAAIKRLNAMYINCSLKPLLNLLFQES